MRFIIAGFFLVLLTISLAPGHAQSPDGTTLTAANVSHIRPLMVLPVDDTITELAFSPDGQYLIGISGNDTEIASVWDLSVSNPIPEQYDAPAMFGPEGLVVTNPREQHLEHITADTVVAFGEYTDTLRRTAISPDGRLVAFSGDAGMVRVWNLEQNTEMVTLRGYSTAADALQFDPTGTILASADSQRQIILLWSIEADSTQQHLLPGRMPLAFSPDSRLIATVSENYSVVINQVENILNDEPDAIVAILSGHFDAITHIAFSPDGQIIATASDDATISLWNPVTGEEQRVLIGHRASVAQLLFSRDGTLLVSISDDDTVRLWDVATGETLTVLEGTTGPLAISLDGMRLASGYGNSNLVVWGIGEGVDLPILDQPPPPSTDLMATAGVTGTTSQQINTFTCNIPTDERILGLATAGDRILVIASPCEGQLWIPNADVAWDDDIAMLPAPHTTPDPLLRISDYQMVCDGAPGTERLPNNTAFNTAFPPNSLPSEAQATLDRGLDLLICHEFTQVTIENCHNLGPGNYSYIYVRKRLDDHIRLVDYHSGSVVAESRFVGLPPPPCPTTAIRGEGIGDPPPPTDWLPFVLEVLFQREGPSRTVIHTSQVNARRWPSTEAEIVRQLASNIPVTLIGRSADMAWLAVVLPDMQKAWVSAAFITIAAQTDVGALPVVNGDSEQLLVPLQP